MNTPQQPRNPPDTPKTVEADPASPMQNGIPQETKQEEPAARPSSDRQATETAASNGS